jgi:predicted metal-binding membrane protein
MWTVMMTAMMFPSIAPTALTWTSSIARTSQGVARVGRTTEFLLGYLVAWALYGCLVFAALYGLAALAERHLEALHWISAGLLLFAGLYQFTPLKTVCLRHCRSPLMFLLQHLSLSGPLRDFRVGFHHGLFCVGCCWGLMIALIAVGIMNVGAMLGVAIAIYLEKLWVRGELLAKALGVLFIAASVLAAIYPNFAPGLYSHDSAPMSM